jgi:xanthine dehydrogenase YagT iron-sulfur-binding subunit
MHRSSEGRWQMTRRDVLETGTLAAAVTMSPQGVPSHAGGGRSHVTLLINHQSHSLHLDPRTTLLDALREHVGLTGSKKGCDHGQCGACTVLIDGRRINACLTLAVMHDGEQITTIEGLADNHEATPTALHPMQAAFITHDGFQCGYCTAGQICSATAMLAEVKAGMPSNVTADLAHGPTTLTNAEIRERMSGNICRCAAYPNIVDAIRDVADRGAGVAI